MYQWLSETRKFLREVWVEVRPKNGRVSWPTFENVKISTKLVVVMSIVIGIFIGICDWLMWAGMSYLLGGGIG